jgi:hypothetical protein
MILFNIFLSSSTSVVSGNLHNPWLCKKEKCKVPCISGRQTGGEDVQLHPFLTPDLHADEWSVSCHCCFTPMERGPGTPSAGCCLGPWAILDILEKEKSFASVGDETPDYSAHCLVTIPLTYAIPASLFCEVVPYKTFIMSLLILS